MIKKAIVHTLMASPQYFEYKLVERLFLVHMAMQRQSLIGSFRARVLEWVHTGSFKEGGEYVVEAKERDPQVSENAV